ncbi:MAG: hypothetical protein RL687_488 [Candidatus Parcubacteria bacterium]
MTIIIKKRHFKIFITMFVFVLLCFFLYLYISNTRDLPSNDNVNSNIASNSETVLDADSIPIDPGAVVPKIATHISTPDQVKALYMSSWIAGVPSRRAKLVDIIDKTELNAVVIDIKDATGRVSFKTDDPFITELGSVENRVRDMDIFIDDLHKKNIYVIGRVSVFQDSYLTAKKPEWAITRKSDGKVWKDRKGLSFLDPAQEEVLHYTVAIAKASYAIGFDEINFDYIRYPSDGNMKDINYKLKEGTTRSDNLEKFFSSLNTEVKKENNIITSADVFGLTTEAKDDMGIGQIWEKIIPHFDYISPMVYPSHYPVGQYGLKNPAANPGIVINNSILGAIKKTEAMGLPKSKIRPWLQDFDMGATYTDSLVRAQIDSSEKIGVNSWMMWDPKNVYTPGAFKIQN